jgi:uncharacterized membrane protein
MSQAPSAEQARSADRMKFFTDAVVAIAMTLLILPLLESITAAVEEELTTAGYLRENSGSLFSFALSFLIIARLWMSHHSLYEHVERYTHTLMWLNVAWMFTIVWLPVPTSMVGRMDTDRLQVALYVGTIAANALVLTATYVVALRSPQTWGGPGRPRVAGLAGSLAIALLSGLALIIALAFPGAIGYAAMLLLFLSDPVSRLLQPRLEARFTTAAVTRG